MSLRDTVRYCLLWYPSIFKNALDVYNHLFCVIGNGYDWKDGCLVDGHDKKKKSKLDIKDAAIEYLEAELKNEKPNDVLISLHLSEDLKEELDEEITKDFVRDFTSAEIRQAFKFFSMTTIPEIKLILETDTREKDLCPYKSDHPLYSDTIISRHDWRWHIYPLCYEYSYICNFPEDIKIDWLMAIDWMAWFISEHKENWHEYMKEDETQKVLDKTYELTCKRIDKGLTRANHLLWECRDKQQSYYSMRKIREQNEQTRPQQESTEEV